MTGRRAGWVSACTVVIAGGMVCVSASQAPSAARHATVRQSVAEQHGARLARAAWQQSGAPLSQADVDDLYQEKCSLCHGPDRTGKPPSFPSIIGAGAKYSDAELTAQIRHGKGRMPAFPSLSDEEVKALVQYVKAPPLPSAPAKDGAATTPQQTTILRMHTGNQA